MDVFPFPKFQFQEVGLPEERSVKLTISGEQPFKGVALKLATGVCPLTCMVAVRTKTGKAISFARVS